MPAKLIGMMAPSESACASRWRYPAQRTSSGTMITPPPTPSRPERRPPAPPIVARRRSRRPRSADATGAASALESVVRSAIADDPISLLDPFDENLDPIYTCDVFAVRRFPAVQLQSSRGGRPG